MGLKDDIAGITQSVLSGSQSTEPKKPRLPGLRPTTAPGQLWGLTEQQRRIETELQELRRNAGGPRMIPRAQLVESPFQTRSISAEAVRELADNLRENELVTPLSVRRLATDRFEIIAGHRRNAAYGELGRAEIPCIVIEMDDEQAERAVFFDNFYPPDICDFEKYLGLRQIQDRHKYTQEDLAKRSGISRAMVGFLMSYQRLPAEAIHILNRSPRLVGAAAAAKLAQLDAKLHPKIAEALLQLEAGKIKQAQLLDWIQGKARPATPSPTVVRMNKSVFAKVLRRDTKITVDFASIESASALEQKIADLIKEHVEAQKS